MKEQHTWHLALASAPLPPDARMVRWGRGRYIVSKGKYCWEPPGKKEAQILKARREREHGSVGAVARAVIE